MQVDITAAVQLVLLTINLSDHFRLVAASYSLCWRLQLMTVMNLTKDNMQTGNNNWLSEPFWIFVPFTFV